MDTQGGVGVWGRRGDPGPSGERVIKAKDACE